MPRAGQHRQHAQGNLEGGGAVAGRAVAQAGGGGEYYSTPPSTPDIVVRLDMTYLRQDFSLMMQVNDAAPVAGNAAFRLPGAERTLDGGGWQAYEPCCTDDEPGRLSPYHRAALYALRRVERPRDGADRPGVAQAAEAGGTLR